jgi:hypothetical protein
VISPQNYVIATQSRWSKKTLTSEEENFLAQKIKPIESVFSFALQDAHSGHSNARTLTQSADNPLLPPQESKCDYFSVDAIMTEIIPVLLFV